jgi:ferredoxin
MQFQNSYPQKLHIDPERCTRVRYFGSSCNKCLSICPTGSIQFKDNSLKIDNECSGCEFCVPACRNEVFSINRESPETEETWYQPAFIYCSRLVLFNADTDNTFPASIIPCLGSMPLYLMLRWVLEKGKPLEVITGHCSECPMKAGESNYRVREQEIKAVFDSLRVGFDPVLITVGGDKDRHEATRQYKNYHQYLEKKCALSRREFFWNVKGSILPNRTVKRRSDPMAGNARSEHRRPTEYMKNLVKLIKKYNGAVSSGEAVPVLAEIEVNDNCTGCGACANQCPTGALTLLEKQRTVEMLWEPSCCSRCDLCKEICTKGALHFKPCVGLENILKETPTVVRRFHRHVCPDCQNVILSNQTDASCLRCTKAVNLVDDLSKMIYGESNERGTVHGK